VLPPEFEYRRVDVEGVTINCAIGGSGPPVLLLHGYPQNHLMWRDVAPALIGADPGYWVSSIVSSLLGPGASLEPAVMEDYVRCFSDPRTIAGSCADYRSAASIDLVHDDETFAAGRKLECPVLVLWGARAFVGRYYEPLAIWQEYAADVRGEPLPTGHFLPQEAPPLVTAALRAFLA
jgi:haloacetate dehalogenase